MSIKLYFLSNVFIVLLNRQGSYQLGSHHTISKNARYLLFNWILLISYGGINLFAVYSLTHSWPTQGSVIWFLLIIFCPAFLYHLTFISYVLILQKPPQWTRLFRLMTLIGGVLFAGGVLQYTQKKAFKHFRKAYTPLVELVQHKMPQPCNANYFTLPSVSQYNYSVTHGYHKPVSGLFYNQQRFIVYFQGGSVDMNNSTLFYDSQNHNWLFFHNNDLAMFEQFKRRLEGLQNCPIF